MKKILVCMLLACVSFSSLDAAASKKRRRGGDESGTVDKKQVIITCANCTQSIEPEHEVTSLDCGHVLCEECSRLEGPWCLHCLDEADGQEKDFKRNKTGHDASQEDGPMVDDAIDTSTTQVATAGRVNPAPVVAPTRLHDALGIVGRRGLLSTKDLVAVGKAAGRAFCPEIIKVASSRIDGLIERIGIEGIFSPIKLIPGHEDYEFLKSLRTDICAMQYLVSVKGAIITHDVLEEVYSHVLKQCLTSHQFIIEQRWISILLKLASYEVRQTFLNKHRRDVLTVACTEGFTKMLETFLECFPTRAERTAYIFSCDAMSLAICNFYSNDRKIIDVLEILLGGLSSYWERLAFIFKKFPSEPRNLFDLACRYNSIKLIKLLCSYIGESEKNSETFFTQYLKPLNLLQKAVIRENIEIINYLIEFFPKKITQAMILSTNELGQSSLRRAIQNNYWEAVVGFLRVLDREQLTAFICRDIAMGTTLIHMAISNKSLDVLQLVLSSMPTDALRASLLFNKQFYLWYSGSDICEDDRIFLPMRRSVRVIGGSGETRNKVVANYSPLHHAAKINFVQGILLILDSIADQKDRVILLGLPEEDQGNTVLAFFADKKDQIHSLAKILMRVSPAQAIDLLKIPNYKGEIALFAVIGTVHRALSENCKLSKATEDLINSIAQAYSQSSDDATI